MSNGVKDGPTGDDALTARTSGEHSEQPYRHRDSVDPPNDILPEDAYLSHFLGAMMLDAALKVGVIDRLSDTRTLSLTELDLKPNGGALLMAMLVDAGVCDRVVDVGTDNVQFRLTSRFARHVLPRRDILEQKLAFLRLAARDLIDGLPDLLFDLPRFMEQSRTFALFRYDKAMDTESESLAHTRRWVNYVTALSETEAGVLIPEIDLTGCAGLLEIGGNTGAFALRLLQKYPLLRATVLDLPAVCRLGQSYARSRPGADRLSFVAGDARRDSWPTVGGRPADAVLFKSMLHDWPETEAGLLLDRANDMLPAGGRIIICERGALEDEMDADGKKDFLPFSMATNLVFAPFYRPATIYVEMLRQRGLVNVEVRQTRVEMSFNIVIATKPGAAQ